MVGVEAAYGSGCLYIRKRVAGYITAEVCNCMYCGVQMLLCCFNPVAEYFGATSLLRATNPYPTTV